MSEADAPIESYSLGSLNDRQVWIELYSDGRIRASDLMSPTGYREWITPQTLRSLQDAARERDAS